MIRGLQHFAHGGPDYFATHPEWLNSHLREIVDALRSQFQDNPEITNEVREATESLNRAAVRFTNTYYRSMGAGLLPEHQLDP